MSNEIMNFTFENQGIRVLTIDGEPWWIGKDVSITLGYGDGSSLANAVRKHVDEEDKGVTKVMTPGGMQNMTIINESGLYSLILGSKLPEAKRFKRWITTEVIPSIRKHGAYMTPATLDNIISDPDFGIRLLNELKSERQARIEAERERNALDEENKKLLIQSEAQQATIAVMKPKAEYYDQILQSKNTMLITQIAKDYGMSAVAFNKMLNAMKVQYKTGTQWVLYQPYANNGYTRSETHVYDDGMHRYCNVQTKWTQNGRLFLYDLLKKNGILPVCERKEG